MGRDIEQERFKTDDYARFAARLDRSYELLRELVQRPSFGSGQASIGAELEMSLIDPQGRPACCNQVLLKTMQDPRFTAEIDRFNLEFNSEPLIFKAQPFRQLQAQIDAAVQQLRTAAAPHAVRPVMVGILPSLSAHDLGLQAMTPVVRYRVLNERLREHRGRPFRLNINGQEPLQIRADDVTYEGANTSFQVHLKVAPESYVQTFNAAQMALGPVLASVGNSPFFLQHRLWEETRIVVFKQAVDDRSARSERRHANARVGLGPDWWRGDLADCLIQHWRGYDALMPVCDDAAWDLRETSDGLPKLPELCTHNGTIWHWNRPVYDANGDGHLRIEFRSLPSGPSLSDMLANAAWMLGLTLGLAEDAKQVLEFDFSKFEYNFYRGAQNGLDAKLWWPDAQGGLSKQEARDLVLNLLPVAQQGLSRAGIDEAEISDYLGIIQARVESGQTGARWQHDFLTRAEVKQSRTDALLSMVNRYESLSRSGEPVHRWSLAQ